MDVVSEDFVTVLLSQRLSCNAIQEFI